MNLLPTSKLERWKYSNLPAFVAVEYSDQPLALQYSGNKDFMKDKSSPEIPWAQESYDDMQLWIGLQSVCTLNVPVGLSVDKPVNIDLNVASNIKSSGHINITLEKGSSLTIHESLNVSGWCNRSMTINICEGATLTHIRTGVGDGVVTNLTQVRLDKNAKYNAYALNNFCEFNRDQIHVKLEGENGKCILSGSKILNGSQHSDTTILIEHKAPNCYSNQNYRNLINDKARGVFQGKVHVHKIAQKTDGYQLCNTVLLSDRSEMDTKPELEIYADDVQCSHGATTAEPDEEPLFYLQARGIPEKQAKQILLSAFLNESLESLNADDEIYDYLKNKISENLNA